MKKQRDSQRSKLYGWELAELGSAWLVTDKENTPLGEAGAQRLVNEVWAQEWAHLGSVPKIRVMNNRGRGTATGHLIKLSGSYRVTQTTWYVLHELTHSIQRRRRDLGPDSWDLAAHGPEFCQEYARLLDVYTAARYGDVIQSMREARLKVSPTHPAAFR